MLQNSTLRSNPR